MQTQTCPQCGKQTEGVNHNNRGLRCTFCFARLIEPGQGENVTAAAQIAGEREPVATGPEYSPSAKKEKEVKPEVTTTATTSTEYNKGKRS